MLRQRKKLCLTFSQIFGGNLVCVLESNDNFVHYHQNSLLFVQYTYPTLLQVHIFDILRAFGFKVF